MTIDSIVAYELVQPNGNIITVNNATYPDLMFALKGGFNNFVSPFVSQGIFPS